MPTRSTFLSVGEAARRLGVHDNTIRRYVDRELLGAVRLPSEVRRVRAEDVERLATETALRPGQEPETASTDRAESPDLADLVAPDLWRSDDEVEEFLAFTYAQRDRDR